MDYSREWSQEEMDKLIAELAHVIDNWQRSDPESGKATKQAYGRVLTIARSMQMHLANIDQHDYKAYARAR